MPFIIIVIAVIMVVIVTAIVFIESAERKIPINYAKRVIKNRVYGGQSSFLPLKVNVSGVIPLIFASSLLAFPSSLTAFVSTPWSSIFWTAISSWYVYYCIYWDFPDIPLALVRTFELFNKARF